ncbi:MAG: hypothetical protein M1834_009158 [Cirrosporium novae-zelandiae]|nr:MAG: hypothetical protein M1834_009158 [Cirrosporium novae-zelandiae]
MSKDDTFNSSTSQREEEAVALLSLSAEENRSSEEIDEPRPQELPPSRSRLSPAPRQSSLSYPPTNGQPRTPRTQNRVRFDVEDSPITETSPEDHSWLEEEDYLSNDDGRGNNANGVRAPLLTGIEAPSVTVAERENDFCPEDHLENARPRSNMQSAFMNMANSIIGAGIIGQPYAFRQAGLVMGVILLVSLTITVDWTIRLIVVNSKLSGADSFQATMEYCFGKSGLVAISVAQWAFAFGDHNSLLIYGSLKKPTMDRFAQVTHYSTSISMLACMVMALTGFLTFGDKTLGNVLNNFPTDNTMVNIARFCFGLNMLTTLPLECFVCREVMTNYYFSDEPWNPNRHLIFTTSLVITAMTMSLITCDLGAVFELIGATSACALAYILPPLCYLKLSTRSWKTVPAVMCIVFGTTVMVTSLILSGAKMLRHDELPSKMVIGDAERRRRAAASSTLTASSSNTLALPASSSGPLGPCRNALSTSGEARSIEGGRSTASPGSQQARVPVNTQLASPLPNIMTDAEERERKRIEAEDLGTQRRAYILSSDYRENNVRVSRSELEAGRTCNQIGTHEFEMNKANSKLVSGWNRPDLKNTDTWEDEARIMDPLNNGQSHRSLTILVVRIRPGVEEPVAEEEECPDDKIAQLQLAKEFMSTATRGGNKLRPKHLGNPGATSYKGPTTRIARDTKFAFGHDLGTGNPSRGISASSTKGKSKAPTSSQLKAQPKANAYRPSVVADGEFLAAWRKRIDKNSPITEKEPLAVSGQNIKEQALQPAESQSKENQEKEDTNGFERKGHLASKSEAQSPSSLRAVTSCEVDLFDNISNSVPQYPESLVSSAQAKTPSRVEPGNNTDDLVGLDFAETCAIVPGPAASASQAIEPSFTQAQPVEVSQPSQSAPLSVDQERQLDELLKALPAIRKIHGNGAILSTIEAVIASLQATKLANVRLKVEPLPTDSPSANKMSSNAPAMQTPSMTLGSGLKLRVLIKSTVTDDIIIGNHNLPGRFGIRNSDSDAAGNYCWPFRSKGQGKPQRKKNTMDKLLQSMEQFTVNRSQHSRPPQSDPFGTLSSAEVKSSGKATVLESPRTTRPAIPMREVPFIPDSAVAREILRGRNTASESARTTIKREPEASYAHWKAVPRQSPKKAADLEEPVLNRLEETILNRRPLLGSRGLLSESNSPATLFETHVTSSSSHIMNRPRPSRDSQEYTHPRLTSRPPIPQRQEPNLTPAALRALGRPVRQDQPFPEAPRAPDENGSTQAMRSSSMNPFTGFGERSRQA